MAYSINGKVYTDHSLMDEIVYNSKKILQGIVVKNDYRANYYETEESLNNAETLISIKRNNSKFISFPFTEEMFLAYGYSYRDAQSFLIDRNNIPEGSRDKLLKFSIQYFLDHFEETNKYYRMLMGLPEYNTTEYDIYIDSSYIPSSYTKDVDFSKPLHLMDTELISVLQSNSVIDTLREEYKGSNYSYIEHLGNKSLDIYDIRTAEKWDILYIPTVESLVQDKFEELYDYNKNMYLRRTYQEAYAISSDYYEECMILMILCQTFNDIIVSTPEYYIRRDIFDIRSVQYFLESNGVDFFKVIPLKYQVKIVKNLNKLIKYKSSTKNCYDILDVFSIKDTSIYRYYLYKKRLTDSYGKYIGGADDDEKYELEFIKTILGDTYDNYIKDNIYRVPYDDITLEDKYWDGEDLHENVRKEIVNRDFTIQGTKYMSIEYDVSLSEYQFQMCYFLGLVLDSNFDKEDIKVIIPSIDASIAFRLSDLFLYLFVLSRAYDDIVDEIIYPTNDRTLEKPIDPFDENIAYDWMKKQYPNMFVQETDRVYGFNTNVNKLALKMEMTNRHSHYQFENGFTLSELGVDNYIVPTDIDTIDQLIDVYQTNRKCYEKVRDLIVDADNRDDKNLYEYLFNTLFTKKFDYNFYELTDGTYAKTLVDVLKDRSSILYYNYQKIVDETNIETRQDNIRTIISDIITTLEYYISGDGLEFVFSFTTVASFDSIVKYIYLILNFFKSYKVYFLDPYVTFKADNKLDNSVKAYDSIREKVIGYTKWDRQFTRDTAKARIIHEFEDNTNISMMETVDIYGHFEPDPDDDYDYDGMYPDTDEEYKDANGGGVDGTISIPFVVINGGRPQGDSNVNIWDLNGATPREMLSYLDVDGGIPYDADEGKQDYWHSKFRYIIDAGSPGTNEFYTDSMHVRVIDRQISADVKISTKVGNALVMKEDGLYTNETWVAWQDFSDFTKDAEDTYLYYSDMYRNLSEDVAIMSDEELLDLRIQNCIESYIGNMRKVVEYMDNNTFESTLKDYVDDQVEKLYDEFYSLDPFGWENF